jgi:hypothetical protein
MADLASKVELYKFLFKRRLVFVVCYNQHHKESSNNNKSFKRSKGSAKESSSSAKSYLSCNRRNGQTINALNL